MRKPTTVVALGGMRRVASARVSTTFSALAALAIASVTATAAAQPAQPPPNAAQPAPAPPGPPAQPATAPAQPPPVAPSPLGQPLIPPPPPVTAPAAATTPPPPVPRPDPSGDARALTKQGAERPLPDGNVGSKPSDVYAEDWWSSARPAFDLHGYYRLRAELFHHFDLGRRDLNQSLLWPVPADNQYIDIHNGQHPVMLCGPIQTTTGGKGIGTANACQDNTQAGANMRFRINPELHISDNLRILSQIDLLDNVVLGSTPDGYYNAPAAGGYGVKLRGGATPLGAFTTTQWAPIAGVNSTQNSVTVERVWGEYMTPLGLLRFGRMPSQWGLGILANAGDGYDSDYQSNVDRIMFVTGIKKWDLYFAGAWDFPNEGATSASFAQQQGQPYDLNQLDDVNQYVLAVVRRRNPELQRLELAKGQPVFNGGAYFVFRNQVLANDNATGGLDQSIGQIPDNIRKGLTRRGATLYIPDLWLQFLYKKFRFEAEAVTILGTMDSINSSAQSFGDYINRQDQSGRNNGYKIQQFGLATQSEFRAVEDKLKIQFGFGYASGDPDQANLTNGTEGLQPQLNGNRTFSEFAFHPDYRVDLILFRHILQQVQGAYYFRPSVDYDFVRDKNGQKLGGGAALIWSRASEFIQTPGHARDLGIELDFQLYYQAKDGTLNDDPEKMGGFFTSLQYGVLFPLGGLGYMPGQVQQYATIAASTNTTLDTSTAQTLRWYLGILF
jgi:uncharacterized protein (TIGR04551 family)